ncbi:MAG TPA: ATP-binding protein [Sphingobacteriaceae bacterium]|nr:ATP-binding protein [Sphingobacteriaceae bacterium]
MCLKCCRKYLINRIHFEGIHSRELPVYPIEALREALINALIHRNYNSTAAVQIRIYDQSLQIINDGELPDGMSIDDLRKPHLSHPRQVLLADVFYKAGFIESWGSGTLKIGEICRKNKLKEPQFRQDNCQFSVTFYSNELTNEHENERIELLLAEIKKDKFISINKLADKIGVNRSTINRDLTSLKKGNWIKRNGPGKGGVGG